MSDLDGLTDLDAFEAEITSFFTETLPTVLSASATELGRARAWRAALFDAGLAAIDYPVEFGGRGLSAEHVKRYGETSSGLVPREESTFGIGVGMALPTIRDHASEEMKQRFLRPGLRGEEIWCQLYSEPGSGSDLASLSTTAELDGDEWVVNGQKVWTSGAQQSQFGILLARTDPDLPKHRGITMMILPMDQDGVEVRPLQQMTGVAEFNEVFMTDARIPRDWIVGEVNGGWRTAVALLAHERVKTGAASMQSSSTQKSKSGRVPIPVAQLIELAERRGALQDPVIRQEIARLWSGERIVGYLRNRSDVHPSIGKLWRTNQGRAAADLAGALAFPASPAWEATDSDADYFSYHILNCRGMSMGGGTDEIQRNTLGERALGLPREPGPDRDTPYRDLPRN